MTIPPTGHTAADTAAIAAASAAIAARPGHGRAGACPHRTRSGSRREPETHRCAIEGATSDRVSTSRSAPGRAGTNCDRPASPSRRFQKVPVKYRGQEVGFKEADLIVDNRFIVDMMASRGEIGSTERARLRALLRGRHGTGAHHQLRRAPPRRTGLSACSIRTNSTSPAVGSTTTTCTTTAASRWPDRSSVSNGCKPRVSTRGFRYADAGIGGPAMSLGGSSPAG